jgi:hypothetical protein
METGLGNSTLMASIGSYMVIFIKPDATSSWDLNLVPGPKNCTVETVNRWPFIANTFARPPKSSFME